MFDTLCRRFLPALLSGLVLAAAAQADIDGHGPDAWQVTGVAANDVLNGRMGPGTNYGVITHFAPGERGLIEVTCVPLVPADRYMAMSQAQRDALPSRWCLMRSADLSRAGWVAARFLREDGATPADGAGPAREPAHGQAPTPSFPAASGRFADDGTPLAAVNDGDGGQMMPVRMPHAGLVYTLPPGWATDEPWFYQTPAGGHATHPTLTFYANMQGHWQPLLWLNLRQFQGAGCIEIGAGSLCYRDPQDREAAEYIGGLIHFTPG